MPACLACSGEIRDAAALWCPYCGASLRDGDTTASHAATISTPLAPGGVSAPDLRLSQYGPLNDARFAPGQIFASRYRIVSLLGRGAMGEVYRAEDLKLGQPVALKLIAVRMARGDERLQQFIAEVRLAREIAHPNVCRVYDIGEAEGWHYLSMEYVDGETLESLLRRIGRLPGEKALDMARQLCAGLAAAHDRGVLHRDLKPSNIMVDGRGRIRIMDFGLAIPSGESTIGELAGTPAYMAPEQLVGDRATERTDVYALGLVFYELFTGHMLFPVRTIEERVYASQAAPLARASLPGIDPAVERIIDSCLERDPAERPMSALAVAALLPGGDPLTAALAEGRMPSPDMIAAAGRKGALQPPLAWALLAAVLGGTVAVASQAYLFSVVPSDVPKPPEALAERARNILAIAGADDIRGDSEFWFAPAGARDARRIPVKFVYRQSAQDLIPQNMILFVTDVDPPADVQGMATVTLDPLGRLIRFDRVPSQGERSQASAPESQWDRLFGEAGLNSGEFVPAEPHGTLLVPHDRRLAWETRAASSNPLHVTAATLDGKAVYFDVAADGATPDIARNPFSTGRTPIGEALFWGLVVLIFSGAAMLARHNLRLGQGDRRAARRVGLVVVSGSVLSGILRAHHVPVVSEELLFLLASSGWALVWGAFTWLMYISLEPYVRRVWPNALISWTRLLSGRWRDPLVGRDVLAGLLAGIIRMGMTIVRLRLTRRPPPDVFLSPTLESLRSVRQFINIALAFRIIDTLEYALGALFLLFLIRVIVRKTWIAVGIVALIGLALGRGGDPLSGWEVTWVVAGTLFTLTVLLRLGLLAYVATLLFFLGLFTRGPVVTLDLDAWNVGMSFVTLLLVAALAIYGFTVALAGRPAFGGKAV
jgi:serine/threonine-protein kinase